ncbi:MAG: hypothetical protein AMXMBFR33_43050 [Candidatus Xenobia bacterium]
MLSESSRETRLPNPVMAPGPRPEGLAVSIVSPIAENKGTQVELQETPQQEAAEAPDLLTRTLGLELAEVWDQVAGSSKKGPKKSTDQTVVVRPGPTPGFGGPAPALGSPSDPLKETGDPQAGLPGDNTDPTRGPAMGNPGADVRTEVAQSDPVEVAEKVVSEATVTPGQTTDSGATEAARVETVASEASAQQESQRQEAVQTEQAQAQAHTEAAQVERKESETVKLESDLSRRETQLSDLRQAVSVKSQQVQELRSRVREKQSMLTRIEQDLNALSSTQDYLDHYDEIERLEGMRYHVRVELENDSAAAARAELELTETQRQASLVEASLSNGRAQLEQQRHQVSKDRSSLGARAASTEVRRTRLEGQRRQLANLEELRPFWAALREDSDLRQIAVDAAESRQDIESRDQSAHRRILNNLAALEDEDAAVDLVGGLSGSKATRGEQALAGMQAPMERLRQG